MKNISTGFGLCVAAAAALAYPFVSSLAPSANASAVTAAASAVGTAATAQSGPTILWYGIIPHTTGSGGNSYVSIVRAWSDGRLESRGFFRGSNCTLNPEAGCPWAVISDSSEGYNAASDINFDEQVNGADLGQLLADWGNAPRQDIPPSDCPLALINPWPRSSRPFAGSRLRYGALCHSPPPCFYSLRDLDIAPRNSAQSERTAAILLRSCRLIQVREPWQTTAYRLLCWHLLSVRRSWVSGVASPSLSLTQPLRLTQRRSSSSARKG